MPHRFRKRCSPHRTLALAVTAIALTFAHRARAQSTPAPNPQPPGGQQQLLEDRLKQVEETNRKLLDRIEELSRQVEERPSTPPTTSPLGPRPPSVIDFLELPSRRSREGGAGSIDNVPAIGPVEDYSRPGGTVAVPINLRPRTNTSTSGGAGARDNPAEPRTLAETAGGAAGAAPANEYVRLRGEFGPGFQWISEDAEFQLQFHNLTQVDSVAYTPGDQQPAHGGFYIPRQRWYFVGRVTKPIEFYTSINRSFGSLDILDAFLNVHYDDRFMWKIGRFKVPYQYEFYAMSETDLIEPERSIVTNNFGSRRNLGTMLWGQLFDKRLDYAVAMSDGGRSVNTAYSNGNDVLAYINGRPFQNAKGFELLKYLNFGASLDYGHENDPVFPTGMRLEQNGQNGTDSPFNNPAFLNFNNGVVEKGERFLGAISMAYFYKSFMLISEFSGGYESYGFSNSNLHSTKVPWAGFFVNPTYFVTGEVNTRRSEIRPLKNFDLRKGKRGPGAIELVSRYAMLDIGQQIFQGGYSDPNLWTNHVQTVDVGMNWYWNRYVKLTFDWQLAVFGNPVLYKPEAFTWTDNSFWFRFQIYF